MKLTELKKMAKERGLKGYSSMEKGELIRLLQEE
ncbi:Rho termination factor N-terminal domain-containing protein [Holtiella tumoricola]